MIFTSLGLHPSIPATPRSLAALATALSCSVVRGGALEPTLLAHKNLAMSQQHWSEILKSEGDDSPTPEIIVAEKKNNFNPFLQTLCIREKVVN